MTAIDLRPTTFAQRYQSVLVPVIFEPWAREIIRRAELKSEEDILDLACGTGAVTRAIIQSGIAPGSLTAVDHSAEMLDVARSIAGDMDLDVEWIEADAAALPFDDYRFDTMFCQQALQFFPDRTTALGEVRRVLKPGGKAVFCVQRELAVNPMLQAQANALDRFVGKDAGAAVRAICSLSDRKELQQLFRKAGFQDVAVEPVTLTLRHSDARAFATGAMGGMHTGDKLSGLAENRIEDAIDAFLTELGDCFDGKSMRFPHASHVVAANA